MAVSYVQIDKDMWFEARVMHMFTLCSTWTCLMLSGNDNDGEFKCDTDGDNGEPNRDMYTCHD